MDIIYNGHNGVGKKIGLISAMVTQLIPIANFWGDVSKFSSVEHNSNLANT